MLPVNNEERPPVWVGHLILPANDVALARDYYVKLGMRHIVTGDTYSVLELRGGTHLVLSKREDPTPEGSEAHFDIMVEDVDVAWKEYTELGFEPSQIEDGGIHRSFKLRDPSGYLLTVNSTHVSEFPV